MANENIERDKLIECSPGDIFYTQHDDQFHLYKLLQHDEAAEAYHVLSYAPFSKLPSTSEINTFKVAIYHIPMHKDSFVKPTLFAKHTISYSDLIGYHEYLKQPREVQQYIPVARYYYNAAFLLIHKEDFEGAIDHYSRVIDLLPDYVALMVYTKGFTAFENGKQLACYCGVVPFTKSSGTSVRYKSTVSPFTNMKLKKLLHLCAMSAIQNDPEMKAYFERKVAEGKNKMSVIDAVRNKLIHRVFAVIRDERNYEDNYVRNCA